MKFTLELLKEMITEEMKRQTADQVRREKESERISRERKRGWDPDLYKLAKGIFTESEQTIEVDEDTPPEQLLKIILAQTQEIKRLRNLTTLNGEQIKNLCNKNNYRSFQDHLKAVNAINAAEKGKLYNNKK